MNFVNWLWKQSWRKVIVAGTCFAYSLTGFAEGTFEKNDWQVTCDNFKTCRAAGFQEENDERLVSVLLQIDATAGDKGVAYLNLMVEGSEERAIERPTMHVGEKSYGQVLANSSNVSQNELSFFAVQDSPYVLTEAQTEALISASHQTRFVVFRSGGQKWQVSTSGMGVILEKIDDIQGRVGTRNSLSKKLRGTKRYVSIKKSATPVTVKALDASGQILTREELNDLVPRVKNNKEIDCTQFRGVDDFAQTPLSPVATYVEAPCWLAAYNAGGKAFLVAKSDAGILKIEDVPAGELTAEGRLFIEHKGRGLGDCLSREEWAWDGVTFILIKRWDTGMCRGFLGGAWSLPEFYLPVIEPPQSFSDCLKREKRVNSAAAQMWWDVSSNAITAFKRNDGMALEKLIERPLVKGPSKAELAGAGISSIFSRADIDAVVASDPICGQFNSEGGFIASGVVWFSELVDGSVKVISLPTARGARTGYASFDCELARGYVEKTICTDRTLGAMDLKMAKLYRDKVSTPAVGVSSVKNRQRQWLKERNRCKNDACLNRVYSERIHELITN